VRIARATNRLDEITEFYCDVLGMDVLARFCDHDGFDGIMLGQAGDSMHFEFTQERGAIVPLAPSPEDLTVLYLEVAQWDALRAKLDAAGVATVASHNPYWDEHGVTVRDPEGFRIVLHRGAWRP
jgi:catechol 2,3-dioxygenase-like lactoylglutathione lyase family enzyme